MPERGEPTHEWQQMGQPWRTESEIDAGRQKQLALYRAIVPNIEQGIYPFKGVKLSRADVEWLLATHENGRGPVDWKDNSQRGREGLDVRAADLRHVDLQNLPLARLHGGLTLEERVGANEEQWLAAGVLMEGANLRKAYLEGATLCEARLQGTILRHAQLQGATLIGTQLQQAALTSANLTGTNLRHAWLVGVYLAGALFSDEKHIGPLLADAHWDTSNLAVVDWSPMNILGDEHEATQSKHTGKTREKVAQLQEYKVAVRANRQFAVALQAQGLNEDAARFAYRAQILQRTVFRRQGKYGQYLFSLVLDLPAGYGYRPIRSVIAYLMLIFGFMGLYLLNAHFVAPHLTWDEALILSVSSFHGRGFFTQNISLGDTYARLAAAEAVVGLLIEISFIATFTRRFFGM